MERIFEAVLVGEKQTARVLRSDPLAARKTSSRDVFVESIPHWLYTGDTPLHLAAAAMRLNSIKILLESLADPNAVNRRGATPLFYACDPRPNSLERWSPAVQTEVIEVLVQHGADVNHSDQGGATALHRAVRSRSPSAVRQLLRFGARTDSRLRARGSSALHLAAQSTGASGTAGAIEQQMEIIGLLRAYGGDTCALDTSGRTPRDWASSVRIAAALSEALPARPR
jgi:ankyrin repeat protein